MAIELRQGRPDIGYGMTETNAYGPQNSGDDYVTHPTSTGRATPILRGRGPRPGRQRPLPIGERGEIWFKGPNLIRGYWNKPEATAETIVDGWLRSGDLGRIDDEGFVYVEDRAKDMVLRGRRERVLRRGRGRDLRAPRRARGRRVRRPPRAPRRGGRRRRRAQARATRSTADELQAHRRRAAGAVQGADAWSRSSTSRCPATPAGKILKRELRDELSRTDV